MAELPELLGVLTARRSELFSDDNEWEQFMVYIEAFRLFLEREAKYRSLWMKYGAADSFQHMRSKLSRAELLLELALAKGDTRDQDDPLDLINYTVFFLRNIRALRLRNTTTQDYEGVIAIAQEPIAAGDYISIDAKTGRAVKAKPTNPPDDPSNRS